MEKIQLDIYTDGSHRRSEKRLQIGAYCLHNNIEAKLSKIITSEVLKSYGITETECSNLTAEYIAFAEILKLMSKIEFKNEITLRFYVDYIGVIAWTNGEWKAKKSYIIKIRDYCLELIRKLTLQHCNVIINKVKGHSGVKGNEMADELAGNNMEINTFDELLKGL